MNPLKPMRDNAEACKKAVVEAKGQGSSISGEPAVDGVRGARSKEAVVMLDEISPVPTKKEMAWMKKILGGMKNRREIHSVEGVNFYSNEYKKQLLGEQIRKEYKSVFEQQRQANNRGAWICFLVAGALLALVMFLACMGW